MEVVGWVGVVASALAGVGYILDQVPPLAAKLHRAVTAVRDLFRGISTEAPAATPTPTLTPSPELDRRERDLSDIDDSADDEA